MCPGSRKPAGDARPPRTEAGNQNPETEPRNTRKGQVTGDSQRVTGSERTPHPNPLPVRQGEGVVKAAAEVSPSSSALFRVFRVFRGLPALSHSQLPRRVEVPAKPPLFAFSAFFAVADLFLPSWPRGRRGQVWACEDARPPTGTVPRERRPAKSGAQIIGRLALVCKDKAPQVPYQQRFCMGLSGRGPEQVNPRIACAVSPLRVRQLLSRLNPGHVTRGFTSG